MKAILIVRVSTDTQEFEQQKSDLISYAIEAGYQKDSLIIVENEESAIKLSIDEREGIVKTKRLIEEDKSINAVFVWELSRLVRIQTDGHILKDYFLRNQIQFFCKNPQIQLFNNEITSPHESGDITFSLFLQMTENEMRTKKARFHRSKIRNAKIGKYSGGFIKYGYYVDDKGYYQINEKQAELIQYLFNEYEKGRSMMKLTKELHQRGITTSTNFVRGILTSEAYSGISNEYDMERTYPQIISVEQFKKCREIAENNNKKADKTNEIYFGKKLIKCAECGTHYIAMKSSLQYLCYGRYGKEAKINPESACKSSPTININVLDSLLWRLAKQSEQFRSDIASQEEKNELEEKIKSNTQHIEESTSSLPNLKKKKERIAENYVDGIYSKKQRDEKFRKVDKEILDTSDFVIAKRNEIKRIRERIETEFKTELSGQKLIDYLKNEISIKGERLDTIKDDLEKQAIIQNNINEINILEGEIHTSKIVVIKYHNDKIEMYRIKIKKKPAIVELDVASKYDDFPETFLPIDPPLVIIQRFVRKSQSKNKTV